MSRYEPIRINKGEGLDHHLVFTDDDGAVIDLSTALSTAIYETYPSSMLALMTATITQVDYDGTLKWGVLVTMDAADAWPDDSEILRVGNLQYFRVSVTFEEGRPDVSPEQWIDVI